MLLLHLLSWLVKEVLQECWTGKIHRRRLVQDFLLLFVLKNKLGISFGVIRKRINN